MPKAESLYPQDWFRVGVKELKRAEQLLQLDDLEGAGFNIQQAVEKYLKGFLLGKGWKLRRIHDLNVLLNDVVAIDPTFEKFRTECLKITVYYMEERYPAIIESGITKEELAESLRAASELIGKIKQAVG